MSKVESWIAAQKAARVVSGSPNRAKTNITVRVDDLRFGMLDDLAQNMGMTRSGFAEQLLELSLTEAWEKYYDRQVRPEDVRCLEERRPKSSGGLTPHPPTPPTLAEIMDSMPPIEERKNLSPVSLGHLKTKPAPPGASQTGLNPIADLAVGNRPPEPPAHPGFTVPFQVGEPKPHGNVPDLLDLETDAMNRRR